MKLKHFTIGALALIGVGEIIRRFVQVAAWALITWGGWDVTEATRAAPWVLAAVGGGLILSIAGMISDSKYYDRTAQKQRSGLTVTESRGDARRGA